jgi:carbon-monoxide dehydrogenase small subunit
VILEALGRHAHRPARTEVCGTCTVFLDGETVRSCPMLAVGADGSEIVTVERLSAGDSLKPLRRPSARSRACSAGSARRAC